MNNFPISTWRLFGAGLQTPPTPFRGPGGTAGLPTVPRLETFGRRSGKVSPPKADCHNPVRDCEEVGKLFPSRSYVDPGATISMSLEAIRSRGSSSHMASSRAAKGAFP